MRGWVAGICSVSLVVAFAVAQFSGVRMLGAVVLVVGGAACAVLMWPVAGTRRTVALGAVYMAAFAVSHPLGRVIGTWPAVLLVAALTAVAAYSLMRPTGSRVSSTAPAATSTR